MATSGYKVECSDDRGEGTDFGSQGLVIVPGVSSPDSLCTRLSAVIWFDSPLSFLFTKFCPLAFLVTVIPILPKCIFYLRPHPDTVLLLE